MWKRLTGKHKATRLFIVFICIGAFLIFFGLLRSQKEETKEYNIILIPKIIDKTNSFWTTLIDGAQVGAKEYQVNMDIVAGKSEEDVKGQIECIRAGIKKKPDAMVVSPCSFSETTEALKEVVDSGIKLVLIDSVTDKNVAQGIVATDNFAAGRKAGKFARNYLDADSQIGIVNYVKEASTSKEREKGMKDGLGDYRGQVVETVYCGSSYDRAYAQTKEMLTRHPKIKLIMGTNEYSAVGAARAVKDMGLSGRVKLVGFDNSIEEIQLLEEGVFQGLVIQKPFNIGYLGVEQAVKILHGKRVDIDLDSGSKLITKKNMYEEENQRLLYPFTGQQ